VAHKEAEDRPTWTGSHPCPSILATTLQERRRLGSHWIEQVRQDCRRERRSIQPKMLASTPLGDCPCFVPVAHWQDDDRELRMGSFGEKSRERVKDKVPLAPMPRG